MKGNKKSYKRPEAYREPYDSVLIVCEGIKSEPNYLKGLRNYYQLSTANIEIIGKGIDPLGLVKYAEDKAANCDAVIQKIEGKLMGYNKHQNNLFQQLEPLINTAITDARKLEDYNEKTKSKNPSTQMHQLVEYLRNIKTYN